MTDRVGTTPGRGAPIPFHDPDRIAEAIIARVGKKIVLALPLGLGKANHVANALFGRAAADPSIDLRIFTALTLEKPRGKGDLERRFVAPIAERLFAGYPELAYATALHDGTLPANVKVDEFFLAAGTRLGIPAAQQSYICANYTHALRYVLDRGVNVAAQLVAKRGQGEATRLSLSCNPDLPREPIDLAEYAIGLNAARTVADGGTLQLGIGLLGDAVTHALILRHLHTAEFRSLVARLDPADCAPAALCESAPFATGLYGVSEMFVEGFLDLKRAGVLKREVDGALLHAAFFLGSRAFYRALREMPQAELAKLRMGAVSFVNELYGDEAAKRRARVKARFINNAMMATLLGAVISDALENGQVVSGVGGQYNFVAQGFALEGARSIIVLRATRTAKRRTSSNILWNYGHTTIPRHLRDVVVTEYGIADLRGKTDRDVIAAMLAIADSRFQEELLRRAKDAGKIEKSFELPAACRDNTPERIARALEGARERGLLPPFPFGSDFTAAEERLIPALKLLRAAPPLRLARVLARGLFSPAPAKEVRECLVRMGLARPSGPKQRAQAALLRAALDEAR